MTANIILVMGVQASGKTSLCKRYINETPNSMHVDYGDLYEKFLNISKYQIIEYTNYDDIKLVDFKIIDYIKEISKNVEILLVEVHPIGLTKVGLIPFYIEHLSHMKNAIKGLILIDVDENFVYNTQYEVDKPRPKLNKETIRDLITFSKIYASLYSVILGIPLKVIINRYNSFEETYLEFKNYINTIINKKL